MEADTQAVTVSAAEGNPRQILQWQVLVSVLVTVLCLLLFVVWFQHSKMAGDLDTIVNNQRQLQEQQAELAALREQLKVAEAELENRIKNYVDQNYGYLSERDEKVDKLAIYFRQQEARLSNLEKALSNF